MPAVPSVIGDAVACQKSPHKLSNPAGAAPEEEVAMIVHQNPCIAACLCFRKEMRKPLNEIFPVLIALEDRFPFDPAYDDMMENPGAI